MCDDMNGPEQAGWQLRGSAANRLGHAGGLFDHVTGHYKPPTAAALLRYRADELSESAEKSRYLIRDLLAEAEAAQRRAAEYRTAADRLDGGEAKPDPAQAVPSLDELRARMAVGDVEGPGVCEAEWLPPGFGASGGGDYPAEGALDTLNRPPERRNVHAYSLRVPHEPE